MNDYNALQLSLNKRLARGLQFLVSYTFSRTEEEITYLNPQDDWSRLSRVVTAADTPHRLLVSTTYQLPFFAGRSDLLGSVLGGWQVNAIVTAQSGLPVGTTAGAVLVGDPSLDEPTMARWFNTCTESLKPARVRTARAAASPWPGRRRRRSRFARCRRGSRMCTPAGRRWWTSRCSRRSRCQGRSLQARFEAFNLFNTPWFGAPNTNVTNAAFGTIAPNQANDPRNIQLGGRWTF